MGGADTERAGVVAPQEQQREEDQSGRLEQVGVPGEALGAPAGGQGSASMALQRPPRAQPTDGQDREDHSQGGDDQPPDGQAPVAVAPTGVGDLLGHPAHVAGPLAGQQAAVQVVQDGDPGRGRRGTAGLVPGGGIDRVGGLLGPHLDDVGVPPRRQDRLVGMAVLDRLDRLWQRDLTGAGVAAGGGWAQRTQNLGLVRQECAAESDDQQSQAGRRQQPAAHERHRPAGARGRVGERGDRGIHGSAHWRGLGPGGGQQGGHGAQAGQDRNEGIDEVAVLAPPPQGTGATDADCGAGDLDDQGGADGQGARGADDGSQSVDDDAPEARGPQSQHDGMDIGADQEGGCRLVLRDGGGGRGCDSVDVVAGHLAGRNVNIINTGRTLHTDEYGNGQDKSRQRSAMGWRCDVRQACLREITAGGSLFCGPEK